MKVCLGLGTCKKSFQFLCKAKLVEMCIMKACLGTHPDLGAERGPLHGGLLWTTLHCMVCSIFTCLSLVKTWPGLQTSLGLQTWPRMEAPHSLVYISDWTKFSIKRCFGLQAALGCCYWPSSHSFNSITLHGMMCGIIPDETIGGPSAIACACSLTLTQEHHLDFWIS